MIIGLFDLQWNYTLNTPYEEPLGGTQSAICYFLEEMAKNGHIVYLINNIKHVLNIRGVIHIPSSQYLDYIRINKLMFDVVIVSCLANELLDIKNKLLILNKNIGTLYCLWTGHDIDQPASLMLKDETMKDMVDLYIFVSEWQRTRYVKEYNISYFKTIIMRNGIGKPFEEYLDKPLNKVKNSMTYCSIPWRGLQLLGPIYEKIHSVHPDSQLKIFSGMNIYKQAEQNEHVFRKLRELDSVEFNYGVSQSKLAEELYKIEYLTYPNIFQETSCITALQAMAVGCLVLTSDLGALKETMNGLNEYVDINIYAFNEIDYMNSFINKLNRMMNLDQDTKDRLAERNREHIRKNYKWSTICKKFEEDITNQLSNYRKFITEKYEMLAKESTELINQQKWEDAIKILGQFIYFPIYDQYYGVLLNLGICLNNTKQYDQAKKLFKICRKIKNDFQINKFLCILELGRENLIKCVKYGKKALEIEFDCLLGNLIAEKLELLGYYHEAVALYENILKIEPTNIICLNNLGNIYLIMASSMDIQETIEKTYDLSLEECVKNNEHRKKELVLSNIIFTNLYNPNLNNHDIFKRTVKWSKYFPKENNLQEIVNKLDKKLDITSRKIRLGYVSTDFITHPVGFMFESILKNHDLNKFELFCYDNSNKSMNDITSAKLRNYKNAKWCSIVDMTDDQILTEMVNDNLDILVDMMGHTRNTRMNILQYKPARILVSYFAYPATTGIKEVDYKISDKYATPESTAKYFTEKLYLMPNGFQCYTPPIELEAVKNYNSRTTHKIHLCCFNNPSKLSPQVIKTFCDILKQLPEAKLFLRYCYYKSSFMREHMKRQFINNGISETQIDIAYDPLIQSLNSYNDMDIALDPFPYNGGTVSSEALYMNTPLITLEGSNYVSRVGVSLLSNLGLEKYIAKSKTEYINKVVELARNEKELKELHQTIRLKMLATDLGDSVSFTKHMEEAYMEMLKNY